MKAAAASDDVGLLLKCNSSFGGISEKLSFAEGQMEKRTDKKNLKAIISATLLTLELVMREYSFKKKRGGQEELKGGKCSQEENNAVELELAP